MTSTHSATTRQLCAKDLGQEVHSYVQEAIERHSRSEEIGFTVGMTVLPTNQPGQFQPAIAIALSMRGALIGEAITGCLLTMDLKISNDQVSQMVAENLEAMRTARSEALKQHGGLQGAQGLEAQARQALRPA